MDVASPDARDPANGSTQTSARFTLWGPQTSQPEESIDLSVTQALFSAGAECYARALLEEYAWVSFGVAALVLGCSLRGLRSLDEVCVSLGSSTSEEDRAMAPAASLPDFASI